MTLFHACILHTVVFTPVCLTSSFFLGIHFSLTLHTRELSSPHFLSGLWLYFGGTFLFVPHPNTHTYLVTT